MKKEAVNKRLEKGFNKIQHKHKNAKIQILIDSEKLDFHYNYSSDEINDPFHIFSIGKMFTLALILKLDKIGHLSLKDPIRKYFSIKDTEYLFQFKGRDHSEMVTIEQLLTHTSGIADYFEDPVTAGLPMMKLIVTEPNKKWTVEELINFTKDKQRAVGVPGEMFHYSDTGYLLLGLIIEKVTNKSFHENLHDEIFTPLKMNDSYLLFYSEPKNQKKPFQQIWFNGIEATNFQSLSVDWAGGGIVSTPKDLLTFYRAFRRGEFCNLDTISQIEICNNKYHQGIYYGTGIMELRFEEFFFLLRGLPRLKGHIGILSTHLFFDPHTESYIIMNFGSDKLMVQSIKSLIEIVTTLKKIK